MVDERRKDSVFFLTPLRPSSDEFMAMHHGIEIETPTIAYRVWNGRDSFMLHSGL